MTAVGLRRGTRRGGGLLPPKKSRMLWEWEPWRLVLTGGMVVGVVGSESVKAASPSRGSESLISGRRGNMSRPVAESLEGCTGWPVIMEARLGRGGTWSWGRAEPRGFEVVGLVALEAERVGLEGMASAVWLAFVWDVYTYFWLIPGSGVGRLFQTVGFEDDCVVSSEVVRDENTRSYLEMRSLEIYVDELSPIRNSRL